MEIEIIYHICHLEEWEAAEKTGSYFGSSQDKMDGFIHFSSGEKIFESAAKHRARQTGLVLLSVEARKLGVALKWEESRGGVLFPHLYGALSASAVIRVDVLPLGNDGKHIFPLDVGQVQPI
jgi:uncharacterized protein (DUF952 family)